MVCARAGADRASRHHAGSPFFTQFMKDMVERQWLMASITSEVGTFGDTRSSICAVQREGDRFTLDKDATKHPAALLRGEIRGVDTALTGVLMLSVGNGLVCFAETRVSSGLAAIAVAPAERPMAIA